MQYKFLVLSSYLFFIWSVLVGFNVLSGELDITDLGETGQGNFIKQVSFIVNFLVIFFIYIITQNYKINFSNKKYLLGTFCLFLFCLVTILNSYVADVSFRRLLVTFIVLYSLVLYSYILDVKLILRVTSLALFALVVFSILACLLIPEGIHSSDAIDQQLIGSWKGIFTHKNVAGAVAAVSVIFLFNGFGFVNHRLNYAAIFVVLFFLLQTGSKTSIVLVIFAILLSNRLVIQWVVQRFHYLIAAFLFLMPIVYFLTEYFFILLDDPTSFTGRSSIWKILINIVADKPLLGSGFQSLYHVGPNSLLTDYAGDWVQFVAHGHNGYIDLTAQIGIIGLLLFFYTVVRPIVTYIKRNIRTADSSYLCVFSIFVFFIAHNFTESSLLDTTRVGWFFISLCFSVAIKEQVNARKHNNTKP